MIRRKSIIVGERKKTPNRDELSLNFQFYLNNLIECHFAELISLICILIVDLKKEKLITNPWHLCANVKILNNIICCLCWRR